MPYEETTSESFSKTCSDAEGELENNCKAECTHEMTWVATMITTMKLYMDSRTSVLTFTHEQQIIYKQHLPERAPITYKNIQEHTINEYCYIVAAHTHPHT